MDKPKTKTRVVAIPEELRKRRTRLYLTAEQAATKAGLSLGRYQQLESGYSLSIGILRAQKLAEALQCEPGDITEIIEEEVSA